MHRKHNVSAFQAQTGQCCLGKYSLFVMRIIHSINEIYKLQEKLSSGMLKQAVIIEVL
jgi:hypothetical protein